MENFKENLDGVIDSEKPDESWNKFFQHVALLGLDNGEKCYFDDIDNQS